MHCLRLGYDVISEDRTLLDGSAVLLTGQDVGHAGARPGQVVAAVVRVKVEAEQICKFPSRVRFKACWLLNFKTLTISPVNLHPSPPGEDINLPDLDVGGVRRIFPLEGDVSSLLGAAAVKDKVERDPGCGGIHARAAKRVGR